METTYLKNVKSSSSGYNNSETKYVKAVKNILSALYIIVPIAAGTDKFLNILTQWTQYLHPLIPDVTGLSAVTIMNVAGVIEIAAGILVFVNRRIGAYIVSSWLIAIALQLIAGGMYLDVAVRDIAMAAGALSLGLLSERK